MSGPHRSGEPAPALLRVARSGDDPSAADLAELREHASAAVSAGVTLSTLIQRSVRALAQQPGATAEPVPTAAHATQVLHQLGGLLEALTDGYERAQQDVVRAEEAARRRFLDDLLHSHLEVGSLIERAERFGIRLGTDNVVAVASGTREVIDPGPLPMAAAIRLRMALPDLAAVVTVQRGCLVVLAPVSPRGAEETMAGVAATLAGLPDGGASPVRGDARWRVGVGRAHSGLHGLRRSYGEAREALTLSSRLRLPHPVAHTEELLVYRVLLRDRTAMTDLVRTTLEPLQGAHGGAQPLLDTLREYFAAGCVTAEAARRLYLSVRAVTYRLARIRALTGHDPTDPRQRFALQVAVTGAQLLGWPGDGWDSTTS